uniref:Cilia- and flagella-associated protein 54 n=1 Tax=Jaculus jaculus TaxID=51337 RepID=A0A8C5KKT5_JACJA
MASPAAASRTSSNETSFSASPQELPPPPPPTSVAVVGSKASSPGPRLRPVSSQDALPTAAFYGPLDAKNPLLASFEKEIRELLGFVKKKKVLASTDEQKHEFHRRCSTTLFNIWTRYAPRLPSDYYKEKLLKVGDSLCQMKFHALSGKNLCNYQLLCDSDVNLQNKESVSQCLHILSSLRLIMQVALPQEHLCWIIFNGTIYIYTICRKLMIMGLASKALEYLLWASMCMESSVPLLSVRYLTWRTTLYSAVCQCHYDCQASIHGEAFARRALAKIDELRQLELMSSSQSQEESRVCYREATIKMAVMIFKRGVYESRRRSKVVFRPKIGLNVKEVQSMAWPRTVTERLLDEMFDSNASQFLAVLEALSDSNRRILQTGPFVSDEVELRDVVSELFMAGKELLIFSNVDIHGKLSFPKSSLLELMIEGKNVISVDMTVKFVKLAFTYEEWGLFKSAAGQLIHFLQTQEDPESKKTEKDLILLVAMEPLINTKKKKGLIFPLDNDKEGQSSVQSYLKQIACHDSFVKFYGYSEDIFHLASILHHCVCACPQVNELPEIVTDIIMFLWQKCKSGIQSMTVSRSDHAKLTQKISTNK